MTAPICPACGTAARLTDGREIYPHRPDLADKPIWACTICDNTYVGCHPGTETPLGFPADAGLREARMLLHRNRIDPLWKGAPDCGAYRPENDAARKQIQRAARVRVYRFLANRMGLTEEACHTGMFTVEQCREAYLALNRVTYLDVRKWAQVGDRPAKPKKERKAKAPKALPEPTEAERGAAAIAAVALRAALADPETWGTPSTGHMDLARPRSGVWFRTWANLPGLILMDGAFSHVLLQGWQYTRAELLPEMVPDLEALAEHGVRPKQSTNQGVAA